MSNPPPPIAYATPAGPPAGPLWIALRVATAAWAVTILVRHAAYWTAVAVLSPATMTSLGLALAESAVLIVVAALALVAGQPTPSRLRTLAILGCAFAALSLVGFFLDVTRLPPQPGPTQAGRMLWMFASRLQVLAPVIALVVAASLVRKESR